MSSIPPWLLRAFVVLASLVLLFARTGQVYASDGNCGWLDLDRLVGDEIRVRDTGSGFEIDASVAVAAQPSGSVRAVLKHVFSFRPDRELASGNGSARRPFIYAPYGDQQWLLTWSGYVPKSHSSFRGYSHAALRVVFYYQNSDGNRLEDGTCAADVEL